MAANNRDLKNKAYETIKERLLDAAQRGSPCRGSGIQPHSCPGSHQQAGIGWFCEDHAKEGDLRIRYFTERCASDFSDQN